MGPNETAITIRGGPRIISVFDVHGRHRVQITHFFEMQIGSQTPCGLYLMLVRRLHRTRRSLGQSIALKEACWSQQIRLKCSKASGLLRTLRAMGCPKLLRVRCRRLTNNRYNPQGV